MKHKFAVQLYTLREELKTGIRPIFKTIKEMGWAGVQISGLPKDYDPNEIALGLKENKLLAAGIHVSLNRLLNDFKAVLNEANLYGTKDIILPHVAAEFRNCEQYKEIKKLLNQLAKDEPEYRFSYHNHAFEFDIDIDGQDALSYILDPLDDNRILAEIDVFWIKKAGIEPLEYIKRYEKRMPIIHLKDMTDDERQTFAEVGTGVIDFLPIFQWGEVNGIEWYVVEQDICEGPPLRCLETSLRNLTQFAEKISGSTSR